MVSLCHNVLHLQWHSTFPQMANTNIHTPITGRSVMVSLENSAPNKAWDWGKTTVEMKTRCIVMFPL
jgi:hypothetical protein